MTIWYEILFHSLPPFNHSPPLLLPGCCQPGPAELHMAIMWFSFDFRLYHQIKDNLCCHQFIFPAPSSNEWQIIQPIDYTLTCVHLHHPPGHGLGISSGSLIGAFSVCNHVPHSPLNLNGTTGRHNDHKYVAYRCGWPRYSEIEWHGQQDTYPCGRRRRIGMKMTCGSVDWTNDYSVNLIAQSLVLMIIP